MIVVCAWCPGNGWEQAVLSDDGEDDGRISHGICQPCSDKLVDEELAKLEPLDEPTAL